MTGARRGDSGQGVWPIEPGRGAGPLKLGMPIDAAGRALAEAGLGPIERVQKGSAAIYRTRPTTVHLYPEQPPRPEPSEPSGQARERLGQIEFILREGRSVQVELFGRPLLGEPLDDVHEVLGSIDPRTERHGYQVDAPGLGLSVWSDGEPPQRPVSSVTVARPVPPALVIAPGFTFARLDRVLNALDFTGGATTLRAPLVAGEPEVAEWTRRQILLRYTFDPVTFLRVLYVDGPEADAAPAVRRVLARIPLVGEDEVLADLNSDDDEAVLRAIRAAGVLRLTRARERLRSLSQEKPEPLRSAAISTLVALPDVRDQG
jgi:hypothetical protein